MPKLKTIWDPEVEPQMEVRVSICLQISKVGLQVYLKSISNSKIVAKGWIRSLDLDEVVGSEEIGPNWCSKMLLVHQLLGLALLFRWCARMIDDGRLMMT
nr:hypothetical protein [Tanacetum cinerariifolium]